MKILVVLSRIPFPLEKGDKLRAYYQIKELSKWHDIYLVALYSHAVPSEAMRELTPFCREVHFLRQHPVRSAFNMAGALLTGLPVQCGYFYSQRNHKRINEIIHAVQPDRIYCQLFRMAEYVRNCRIPKVLDYQDAFSKGMERRAQKAFPLFRPIMRMEARRIARYETDIFDDFEHTTMITALDRDYIQHPMNEDIVVIPNGVDFNKYSHPAVPKTHDLIFSGNMNYPPNVDAAIYLTKEIFPELKKKHPEIKMMIAGADPAKKVRALQSDSVTVTGWVPSMTNCYARSRIFIAPMRLGTGLQNKLLEAMSMRLPCVTSPLASKPLDPAAKEGAVAVCNTTLQYVETLDRLLSEPSYYQEIAEKGSRFVHEHYDWANATQKLEALLRES
jgi:sugar transferase (PEP-CTERM/EpsH1 system associated)